MVESKLAQITAAIPINNEGKIPGQPKNSLEKVNAVTTRGGKSTRDPPNPNNKARKAHKQQEEGPSASTKTQKDQEEDEEMAPQDFVDTSYLSFPTRKRKQVVDEQFARFIEMIEKIHVSVPLMDILHVPSYAKYIKDIINNKWSLPSTKVVKLAEECSAAILNRLPEKKKDPGCPIITCSIGTQQFDHALCDLGAGVSVMPKTFFDKLNFTHLAPTPMMLQLADSTVRYPVGIAEDIPIWKQRKNRPSSLGDLSLASQELKLMLELEKSASTSTARKKSLTFGPDRSNAPFRIKYGPNPQSIKEVEIQPQLVDSLAKKTKKIKKRPEQKKNNPKKKEETPKVVPAPPKKDKKVWKQKQEALKSTSTPPKSNKMVWRPKKVQSSSPTPPGTDVPSSSKK
ncbi:uncharacterized protein [Miscanthus floridulus]|uniref:uncharacterized protein n=1 Tax=Miscanthus floridulus TaxID=154761 RepID=UPI003458F6A0